MKRKVFGMLMVLLLVMGLAVSAYAGEAVLLSAPAGGNHVTDKAGILTQSELASLESQAESLSAEYDFGLYIYIVEDYRTYTGGDVMDAGMAIYNQESMGYGDERNGLLLLLSMADRDYTLLTHGDYGNYAFTDNGREAMDDDFLDDFGNDNWYDGFCDYLDEAEDYLVAAANGEPYNPGGGINMVAVLGLPLIVAGIVILVLNGKMKSVAKATKASAYMVGKLELRRREDHFTHSTQVKTKIESNSGSGGGKSRSSGSFSGTSGKF